MVFLCNKYFIIGQAIECVKDLEFYAVIPRYSFVSRYPQVTLAVAINVIDVIAGQSIINSIMQHGKILA